MMVLRLVLKEILHRKVNFLLGLLAVATAVATFIAFFTAGEASNRETARLMLSMGFNLHIISKEADMNEFLLTGIPDRTIPEQCLLRLASSKDVSYNHLASILHKRISWRGMDIILTGIGPEVCPPGQEKTPMHPRIDPGTLYVGYRVANALGLSKGDTTEIEGKTLKVAQCLGESGSVDDIRIQCHLRDAQDILKLPGQISEIRAVDCLCFVPTDNPVSILRKEIAILMPEAQVLHTAAIASARAQTRQMVGNMFAVIIPLVVIACGVWIGTLAIMNVRDRQQEIGIMRALGYGSGTITLLFLGKAVLIGIVGAVVGFLAGTSLALKFGPDIFKITAAAIIKPEPSLFILSLVFAPLFAAIASFIPAMIAVTYDPAVTLREE